MVSTTAHIVERLIPAVSALRDQAAALESKHRAAVEQVHPLYQESARNLLHYLSLRQTDIRDLQKDLAMLGLSSLGRAEANTLSTLDAVLEALRALAGLEHRRHRVRHNSVDMKTGVLFLEHHAEELLGRTAGKRATRIMVTLPTEAAQRPELARELLEAGMDIARINCAHDNPEAWRAMIRHVRSAEKALGRSCRIYADLAGPKLRTGAILPLGRLVEFGPERDSLGQLKRPARIWLTPSDAPQAAPPGMAATVPCDPALLAPAQVQDELRLEDARGTHRSLVIAERQGGSCIATAQQHVYLRDGSRAQLLRAGSTLSEGGIGPLPEVTEPLLLRPGDHLHLTKEAVPGRPAQVDAAGQHLPASIPCTLAEAFQAARAGDHIWFDDGKIGGHVLDNDREVIRVEITHASPTGSKLRSEKGINLPDTELQITALTDKDISDLTLLAPLVDLIGLSFVRQPKDVEQLQEQLLKIDATHLGVVLKIETRQAFENLPLILLTGLRQPPVGVMVARGDLAVEIGFHRLAEVQEEILWFCEAAHVPVIWATQVLETMAKKGAPSRAEVSDAALSARAECVMLNKGPYLRETTHFLGDILERISAHTTKRRPMLRKLAVSKLPETPKL